MPRLPDWRQGYAAQPRRVRAIMPEQREAELEAAHRRMRDAIEEVNRKARAHRARAGIDEVWRIAGHEPESHTTEWVMAGVAGASAAAFLFWLWRSGKESKADGLSLLGCY